MMIRVSQVVLSVFLLFALSRVVLRLKEGQLRIGEFLFWSGLFILALLGVIEPKFTTYVAHLIGIGRGADVVIYASIALLFYLIFRTNILLENVRSEITELVRRQAIKEAEENEKQR
jgi:hypothetical protein